MKRYFSLIFLLLMLELVLKSMVITVPQILTTSISSIMAFAHAYHLYQTPAILNNSTQVIQEIQPDEIKISTPSIPAHEKHLHAEYYHVQPEFKPTQSEQRACSFTLEYVYPSTSIADTLREQRFLTEQQIQIQNMRMVQLIHQYPQVKQGYIQHVHALAHLIIDVHNPHEEISQKSRIALVVQEPLYGPHYDGLRNALFTLLPTFCTQDGQLEVLQKVENAHLDVAKSLRDLFSNDQKNYLHYLQLACQKGIPGMEKILQAELEKPGSTGIKKSWSDISKIFWFNKDDLFNKARNNPFNKDMFTACQLAQEGRIGEAERLFKQRANMDMWMENPDKHAKLCQYFFSSYPHVDLEYGIFKKYQQDPLWKTYPHKEFVRRDFLDYRNQQVSCPQSLPQSVVDMQSVFKAREELKESCIATYELSEFSHDPQCIEVVYHLVDLGSDPQKHIQLLYYMFNNHDSPHHGTVKKIFFNDRGSLKIAEKNKAWQALVEKVQIDTQQKIRHEHTQSIIDLCKEGKLQEALRRISVIVDPQERELLKKVHEEELAKRCPETGIKKAFMADPWWIKFAEKDILKQQHKYYMSSSRAQLPRDIQKINKHLESRHEVISNWLNWSKIPFDCAQEVRTFLYNLLDSASDVTTCIEGFNSLLLNAHHPGDAALAEYFFTQEGILRIYEDHQHAGNFKLNKDLSWPVQRQITEYANKILSLNPPDHTPLFIFEQIERAWAYIDAACQSSDDNEALVYAYLADGIFQALQGSPFHRELFNLPYLFDYKPNSPEYAANFEQFKHIARILSAHEVEKQHIILKSSGGDQPEQPQNNNNGGPHQPPHRPPHNRHMPNPNKNNGPENSLIVPAVVTKELCEHHEVVDEAELALVQWFNKLDVAIKNNIRLADNFFTHLRYGSWDAKLQKLSGAHTFDAKCCLRFEHIRTLVGGHGEQVVRWIHNGVAKQSSIFIDFNARRFIEHLVKVLESGAFKVAEKDCPKIITYLSDCSVQYVLQASNGKIFNTAFPDASFIFSTAADTLPKCVEKCLF